MNQKVNKVYKPLFEQSARYFILMGGRGGGRSTVASQYANAKLISDDYFRCAIMRYILGDIRNSIYREITDRAEENEIYDLLDINDSLMKLEYGNNSINAVGFRKSSSDQKSKLKSLASYNCVIIEEADEIPEEDFMQLDDTLRTIKGDIKIILLLNPPAKSHWIVKRWINIFPSEQKGFYNFELKPDIKDTVLIRSNYKDNESNISPQSIAQYENYRETKPSHYWNMVKGLIPETVVGKIYNNWRVIEEIPYEARLERRGLDFGYTNDPSGLLAIYYYNGGYILDEEMFRKGMSNKEIANIILNCSNPNALVMADSAEPKSIDEIKLYGVNILPSQKGPGSVNQGIQYVQDQKISVTSRSKNLLEEYENYAWKVDKDSNILNVPEENYDHLMDALRYGMESLRPMSQEDLDLYGHNYSSVNEGLSTKWRI
jgi:phage terminase large subunit